MKIKHILFFIPLILIFFIIFFWSQNPQISLWVWNGYHKLNEISEDIIPVVLIGSIEIYDDKINFIDRMGNIGIKDSEIKKVIIRIDNFSQTRTLDTDTKEKIVKQIVEKWCSNKKECQIDFDARTLERNWYKRVLKDLSLKLKDNTILSMTALASWCYPEGWLTGLPVSYAVPMVFSLQNDNDTKMILSGKSPPGFLKHPLCTQHIGISMHEPIPPKKYFKNKKIFVFNNDSWDTKSVQTLLNTLR